MLLSTDVVLQRVIDISDSQHRLLSDNVQLVHNAVLFSSKHAQLVYTKFNATVRIDCSTYLNTEIEYRILDTAQEDRILNTLPESRLLTTGNVC